MFNMYLRATGGTVSWLFYMLLNLLSPIFRGISILLVIGGGAAFLVMGMYWLSADTPQFVTNLRGGGTTTTSYEFLTFLGLCIALVGMSGLIFSEIKMDQMFLARLYPDEAQDDGVSRWVWLRNCAGLLALGAAFSFAAHYAYPKLPDFAWPVIGFWWWLVAGVALSVCRSIYRLSTIDPALTRYCLGLLALLVAFSFAAYYHYPLLFVAGRFVLGFFGWLVTVAVLSIGRWFYLHGAQKVKRLANKVSLVVAPKKTSARMTPEEIEAAADAWLANNTTAASNKVVVPFRRRV